MNGQGRRLILYKKIRLTVVRTVLTMQENKPDTKTRILNTALRLFAVSGVENVSMRDIANAVGIKAASIYNHYVNKEQIVDACYDFFLNTMISAG